MSSCNVYFVKLFGDNRADDDNGRMCGLAASHVGTSSMQLLLFHGRRPMA
jgi:hypothetical protein